MFVNKQYGNPVWKNQNKETNKQYEELNLTNVLYEWHMCGFRFIL